MNVLATNDSRPPEQRQAPTSTDAVASPRGIRWLVSHCTAGARSAASSTEIATGMTTTRNRMIR